MSMIVVVKDGKKFSALQWTGNLIQMCSFMQQDIEATTSGPMTAEILGAKIKAEPGDWILKDEKGQFSVCEYDEIFSQYKLASALEAPAICAWCNRSEEWPDIPGGKMVHVEGGVIHEGCAQMYVILNALDEIKEPGKTS